MLDSWPGYRSVPVLTKVARPKAVLQSVLAFFLCLWDSRDMANHYALREWPAWENLKRGTHNVKHDALVPVNKILLPSLTSN